MRERSDRRVHSPPGASPSWSLSSNRHRFSRPWLGWRDTCERAMIGTGRGPQMEFTRARARAGRTPRDGGRRRSVGRGIGVLHCCRRRRFALHGTALHPARPPLMVFHRNRSSGDIIICTRKKGETELRSAGEGDAPGMTTVYYNIIT